MEFAAILTKSAVSVQLFHFSFYIDMCADVFGSQFNNASIYAAVANTNAFYGGRDRFNVRNLS